MINLLPHSSNSPSAKIKMELYIFFLWPAGSTLSFVSGVPWRDITGRGTFVSWFWCALAASCHKHTWLLQPPVPAMQSRTFFSNWLLLYVVVSTNQPPAASAGIPRQLLRASPLGGFVAEPLQWETSPWTFPRHPRGWISSKFYQHSATVTSLPSKEPRPAILSPTRSTVEERASLGLVPCFKPRGRGRSLYLLFLCSSEFSLLPNSQPSSKWICLKKIFFLSYYCFQLW